MLLTAAFIAAFEWTWLRPLIQHVVHERSGRRIDFDALEVGLNSSFQPTVRLRNLVVQNAPWASPQPMLRAAELGFVLAWPSLRGGPMVLTRLDLVDAVLDLERRADGLRNWRLLRPDNRGPGQVRVLSVDARDTRVRFVHRGLDLAFDLQVTPVPAPMASASAFPLTRQIRMTGVRAGIPFALQGSTSEVVTLFDTRQPFALRLDLHSGAAPAAAANVVRAEGTMHDLLQIGRVELDLRFAGSRPGELAQLLGVRTAMPPLPIEGTARLWMEGRRWRLSALQARVGRGQLAGELALDRAEPGRNRSTLRANITSARVHLDDFRRGVAPAAAAPGRIGALAASPALDADIDFQDAVVEGLPIGPATGGRGHATLRDGRWSIEPLAFAVAGGRVAGRLVAETVQPPTAYTLDLRLRGLQLERLARAAPGRPPLDGALDARVVLRSQGDSLARLAGAVSGTLQAELVGATLPETLHARLALDGGRLLRSLFVPGERARITCSALELRFEAGRGSVRRLAFDTPHAAFTGAGRVDFDRAAIDLVLTPRRKQTALLALDRALQLSGPLAEPRLALVPPGTVPIGEPCVRGSAQ